VGGRIKSGHDKQELHEPDARGKTALIDIPAPHPHIASSRRACTGGI
jgi:hypothetical protein